MKTTVEIKKMGINGEGIGYINRKVVFVKGALLGETVEVDAQQYKNKNYYLEGIKMLLVNNETPENYKSRYEEYQKAYETRKAIIDNLYNEIKIIKKLKV